MNPILIALLVTAGVGLVAALLLCFASKFFSVKVDEKIPKVRECLPGANCGGCGFAGCDGYAEALATGKVTDITKCAAGGKDTVDKLSKVLGAEGGPVEFKKAYVFCNGDCYSTKRNENYNGDPSCNSANLIYGGGNACLYGCLGFGDCVQVCPQNAIHIVNGVAKVYEDGCIGCGSCANVCPKKVIRLVPAEGSARVTCSNHSRGATTRKVCVKGCLGCGLCAKECPSQAISIQDNLAVVDEKACCLCGLCETKCPVHAISLSKIRK